MDRLSTNTDVLPAKMAGRVKGLHCVCVVETSSARLCVCVDRQLENEMDE